MTGMLITILTQPLRISSTKAMPLRSIDWPTLRPLIDLMKFPNSGEGSAIGAGKGGRQAALRGTMLLNNWPRARNPATTRLGRPLMKGLIKCG